MGNPNTEANPVPSKVMKELREWRELDRRRDPNMRKAAREGETTGQIAIATGLTYRRVQQIIRPEK